MKYILLVVLLCSNAALSMDRMDIEGVDYVVDPHLSFYLSLWVPLYTAIRERDAEKAKLALEKIGKLPRYTRNEIFALKDEKGDSLLHVLPAAGLSYGDGFGIFTKLVDLAHPVNSQNNLGRTPLHLAVDIGFKEICLFILEIDPDLYKLSDFEGMFPIHIAAKNKSLDLLQLLLSKESRVQLFIKDAYGDNAFAYVLDSLKYHRPNNSGGTSSSSFLKLIFELFAEHGDQEAINMLLSMIKKSEEKTAMINKFEKLITTKESENLGIGLFVRLYQSFSESNDYKYIDILFSKFEKLLTTKKSEDLALRLFVGIFEYLASHFDKKDVQEDIVNIVSMLKKSANFSLIKRIEKLSLNERREILSKIERCENFTFERIEIYKTIEGSVRKKLDERFPLN